MNQRRVLPLLAPMLLSGLLGGGLAGCRNDPSLARCAEEPLPLQNPRSHTLGETFYLPVLRSDAECPAGLAWEVASAPAGSRNVVYSQGAPQPRFTPDVPGDYTFRVPGASGQPLALRVVERTPAERFRNHHLTPLYGAARVGDEIWTANGASYTVTRVGPASGAGGTWQKRGEITVGAWPAALAWRDPLPYVLVAHRGGDTIGFIDRTRGVLEDALWVGDEPTGLAVSPDARRLYVTLPTMRQVAVVDLQNRSIAARVELGFDPRAVTISPDGGRLYVASYRSGNREKDLRGAYGPNDDEDVWIVDTATLRVTDRITGVANNLRALAISPDGAELYVAATDGDPTPSQADPTALPFVHQVAVLGADPAQPGYAQVLRRADLWRQSGSTGPVVNPSGIVASGDTLWVSSESSAVLVALDRTTLAERARVPVGLGARQVLALDNGSVAVHAYLPYQLWVIDSAGTVQSQVSLTTDVRPADVTLGENVFYRPGGNFAQNHACASCHVETQNDGMIWRFGPQIWHNVRPLQLLAATRPLEWGAYVSSAENFGYQGPGSIVSRPATPEEARGLSAFLNSLLGAPRATGYTRLDGSYTEPALRGKAIFEGKGSCTSCHSLPLYTDRRYIPVGKSGEPADVPSLFGVYRHGVYLVAGRARGLDQVVDVAINFVRVTLTDGERADLTEFLRELTPKGGAPLGMYPDNDNREAVYPDIQPWVSFADPVDDTQGATASAVAAQYVVLETAGGQRVPSSVRVEGMRIQLVPNAPLTPGASYRFRALPGLPFLSGGALWAERRTDFTVARPATATLPSSLRMTVTVPGPGGVMTQLPLVLVTQPAAPGTGAQIVEVQPVVFGTQQRQTLWLRLDSDRFLLESFALPVSPTGAVADANRVSGTVTATQDGAITRIEGTWRLTGPGIDVPNLPFVIVPNAP